MTSIYYLTRDKDGSVVSNGNLRATVDSNGLITFERIKDGRQLLRTTLQSFGPVTQTAAEEQRDKPQPATSLLGTTGDPALVSARLRFAPIQGEKVYGLGEHRTGSVQNKPISIMFQNSQVCLSPSLLYLPSSLSLSPSSPLSLPLLSPPSLPLSSSLLSLARLTHTNCFYNDTGVFLFFWC